jgi:hypothetical protein
MFLFLLMVLELASSSSPLPATPFFRASLGAASRSRYGVQPVYHEGIDMSNSLAHSQVEGVGGFIYKINFIINLTNTQIGGRMRA